MDGMLMVFYGIRNNYYVIWKQYTADKSNNITHTEYYVGLTKA